MPPWRRSGSFEAIWFLIALEERYCLLCALEYDVENGDVSRCLVISRFPQIRKQRQLDCSITLTGQYGSCIR